MDPAFFSPHVTGVKFRRALFGYRPADVDGHLEDVQGWFRLAGLDELLRERSDEVDAEADRRRAGADAEAARIVDDARREAKEITAAARREADALVAEAVREAELERRGRSRIGRPIGDGRFARSNPLARH